MRRARVRTTHATPAVAAVVAGAIAPDNTDSMETATDGRTVVTTIERETTGGLHASVDDYVVNLSVADRLTAMAADTTARSGVAQTDDHTDTTHNTHE